MPKRGKKTRKQINRYSKRQEEKGAKRIKGVRQPGSGNKPTRKGDAESEYHNLLVDYKFTDANQRILTLAELLRLHAQAARKGLDAVTEIEFAQNGHTFCVVEKMFLLDLLDEFKDANPHSLEK